MPIVDLDEKYHRIFVNFGVFMVYVYYLFCVVAYIVLIPVIIGFSFAKRHKKSFPSRFFLINNPPFDKTSYWFHSCSLGETKTLAPIINKLEHVNISVITNTGYEQAKKFHNADVRFLPFEIFLPFWVKKCKCLVVMEAELWLMLFFVAKKRCSKTILINARISDKSYPKYYRFRWFYRTLFRYVDIIHAQSEKDKERLMSLGARNVKVSGNIKTVGEFKVTKKYINTTNKQLIVAGSTHKKEEEIILQSVDFNKFALAIVPRHPERFDEVWKLVESFAHNNNLKAKRLDGQTVDADIVLVDKMGELINFYAVADVVVLGGAFGEFGGHNPIEVAYFNKPLISGKNIFNQQALFECVDDYYLVDSNDLKSVLNKPLKASSIKNRGSIDEIIGDIVNP